MPHIEITWDKGRSADTKRKVAAAITDAVLETVGGQRDWVTIIFHDIERDNWAVGGRINTDRHGPLKPGDHP